MVRAKAMRVKRYRKISHFLLLGILSSVMVLPLLGMQAEVIRAQASGYDLIAAVNQLRASNGLSPYQVDGALMAAAQAHSEYMASTNTISHTGSGGTRARDRAIAAGYGGGAQVFVSENIAAGYGWSALDAVQIWQGDSLHLNTMLSADYTAAGAGVAVSGHTVYFTLDVGSTSGSPGSGSGATTGRAAVTIYPQVAPVDTATPMPDGSIIHVIQPGQALWNVAAIYGVDIEQIISLNKLTSNTVLYPGDKLVVKPPNDTPTPTLAATDIPPTSAATVTPAPTSTLSPAEQVALTETAQALYQPSPTPQPSALVSLLPWGLRALQMIIAVLVVVGAALFIAGSIMSRLP